MSTVWLTLADAIVALHYAFLAYLLVGGFLAWRWPRTAVLHVAAAIWAVLVVATGVPCPLTALQNNLREHAGQHPLDGSFINLYVRGTFYPTGEQAASQAVLGLIIVLSWAGLIHQLRRPARMTRRSAAAGGPAAP